MNEQERIKEVIRTIQEIRSACAGINELLTDDVSNYANEIISEIVEFDDYLSGIVIRRVFKNNIKTALSQGGIVKEEK